MNVAKTIKAQLVRLTKDYLELLVEGQLSEKTSKYDVVTGNNMEQTALHPFRGIYKSEVDKRQMQSVIAEEFDQIYIWGLIPEPTTSDDLIIDGKRLSIKEVSPVRVGKIVVMYLILIKK